MSRSQRTGGVTVFAVVQVLLIAGLAGWATYRIRDEAQLRALPPLRNSPLVVGPLYDYDVIVTDEQLQRLLAKLPLIYKGKDTRIYHTDHALRFWTALARFEDPAAMSGEDMRKLLTDHLQFEKTFGNETKSLLIDAGPGVQVRVAEGPASSSHVDHTMACLAEVGTPLDFPIVTPNRQTTYRAIVEQALRDFRLNQLEYEWSSFSFALFLETDHFYTSEGQLVTFDMLADRIMREKLPRGVCFGNHRVHALVMLLRVDDQKKILSAATRAKIMDYLHERTKELVAHQHPDGFWNRNWPTAVPPASQPSSEEGDRLSDRIIATGHALEWWALAPEELHPPREVLVRAGQWLVNTVDGMTPAQIDESFSFLSHAGRALSLWRGKTPPEALAFVPEAKPTEPDAPDSKEAPSKQPDAAPEASQAKPDQPEKTDSNDSARENS